MTAVAKITMITAKIIIGSTSATRGIEFVEQDAGKQTSFCSTTICNLLEFSGKCYDETTRM